MAGKERLLRNPQCRAIGRVEFASEDRWKKKAAFRQRTAGTKSQSPEGPWCNNAPAGVESDWVGGGQGELIRALAGHAGTSEVCEKPRGSRAALGLRHWVPRFTWPSGGLS
jgi:hypothetical protein